MDKLDMSKEYSDKFDELRKNRVKISFYKYGSVSDNFGMGLVDALGSHDLCIKKYMETGNTEYLCDAANYLMFEFMYPKHEKSHFKSTDSSESAWIVGMGVNEMERFKNGSGM